MCTTSEIYTAKIQFFVPNDKIQHLSSIKKGADWRLFLLGMQDLLFGELGYFDILDADGVEDVVGLVAVVGCLAVGIVGGAHD